MTDPAPGSHDDGPDDDDLEAFVRGQRGAVHPARVVLAVAATLCAGWVLVPTVDELAYHLSHQPSPVDLGDANAAVLGALKDGTRVKADVVLGNKAAEIPAMRPGSLRFGPILVREVVGAPLFIEYDANRRDLLPFSEVTVEGRLISFSRDRGELADVAAWFERELRVALPPEARAIVVDERPGGLDRYLWTSLSAVAIVVLSWGSILRRRWPR